MAVADEHPLGAFEALHLVANLLRNTRETPELDELRPTELLKLSLACLACDWDVTPDQLSAAQRENLLRGRWVLPIFSDEDPPRPIGGVTREGKLAGVGRRRRTA